MEDVDYIGVGSDEAWDMLDRQAQRYLGISGREFVDRYDSGYYVNIDCGEENWLPVYMLLPFIRTVPYTGLDNDDEL